MVVLIYYPDFVQKSDKNNEEFKWYYIAAKQPGKWAKKSWVYLIQLQQIE